MSAEFAAEKIADVIHGLPITVEKTTVNKQTRWSVAGYETPMTIQQLEAFAAGYRMAQKPAKTRTPKTPSRFADAIAALKETGECEFEVKAAVIDSLKSIRNGFYAACWSAGLERGSFSVKTVRLDDGGARLEADLVAATQTEA